MAFLRRAVEIVTFVLGAFSGTLKTIAPPDETKAGMTIGIVSFGALLVLLFVSALAQGRLESRHRKYWLVGAGTLAVLFLISAYIYDGDRARLTLLWPPNGVEQQLYVTGDDNFTPAAQAIKNQHPDYTPVRLVSGYGGIDDRTAVWPAEAIQRASRRLKLAYVIMVLSLTTAIFSLTEGVLVRGKD